MMQASRSASPTQKMILGARKRCLIEEIVIPQRWILAASCPALPIPGKIMKFGDATGVSGCRVGGWVPAQCAGADSEPAGRAALLARHSALRKCERVLLRSATRFQAMYAVI